MESECTLYEVSIVTPSCESFVDDQITIWRGKAVDKERAKITALAKNKASFNEDSEVFVRPFCS